MAIFSRNHATGMLNVHDKQTMWFEYELGQAHLEKGELR